MAVPKRFVVAPNAATRELWRVAESGDIDNLEELLPAASINARNENGMTALMRAAYHGRAGMVRALLDHGADPNITRNDNFTALSLAAFFGHSEIVEQLMSHGARTDIATRYGTSAHIWAKARSFGEVAQCLQKRRQEEVVQPRPTPAPVLIPEPIPEPITQRVHQPIIEPEPEPEREPEVAQPRLEPALPVVRTLSEPPEIWDLVHEAPRNFSAGSTFVARVGSITAGVVLGIVAFLVVAGGIAGVWYWKKTRPSQPVLAAPLPPVTVTNTVSVPTVTAPADNPPADNPPADNPMETPSISVPDPVVRRSATRRAVTKPQITQIPADTTTTPTAPPEPVAPKVDLRTANTGATANKPATPLSPQMISPPKTQQPKGKVIQWP